jgi:hypothetical protein
MPFLVSAFGDRWLLATPRDARMWASPKMKPSNDTMAFIAAVDIVELGEALGYRGARFELRRIVEDHLRRGTLVLLRETRPRLKLDPVREPPPPPYEPIPDTDPIIDDPRALRILQCDPLLTLEQPLRFTFMIRGLVGRSTTLRITDKAGVLVHERPLEPAETSDGAHKGSWDGNVTVGPNSGKRIAPGSGPCALEIVHDNRLRDEATFSLPGLKRLELTVLDHADGTPLAHLVLHVDHRDGRFEQLETDDTGTVRLTNLPPSHRVSVLSAHDPQSQP